MKRLVLSLVLTGCAAGSDNYVPLIRVAPNVGARMYWMGHQQATKDKPAPARVHPLRADDLLTGAAATGRIGDVLIENDEVVFVIAAGNLVDAADVHARVDELGGVTPAWSAVYTSHTSGVLADGTALVEARGYQHEDTGLVVATRYTLHPNDRALVIETTVSNTTARAVTLDFGDTIDWGASDVVAADRGRAFTGASKGAYVGAVGHAASYAVTTPDGEIAGDTTGHRTTTALGHKVAIEAGKSAKYSSIFLVGPRADVSGLVAELTKMSGGEVGVVRVDLVADDTRLKVPNATVEIGDANGKPIMDLRGNDQGEISGELPVGKYTVRYMDGDAQPIEVVANQASVPTLQVKPK